jgi:LmbE family N-acetylglucosaminyl deacetylase
MECYIPDGSDEREALTRTTHLAIAAHQDDIEIMAYDGILRCFGHNGNWFTGIVVTNGSGSPRSGIYADYTDDDMLRVRKTEQKKAAHVGEYSAQLFLDFTSAIVKEPAERIVIETLKTIILQTQPNIIYTHNLADKHETHVAVALRLINALRELDYQPEALFGCEVWRSLDWMDDEKKVKFNVTGRTNLENALLGVYDSQICGGKRYDLATAGRRLANATYAESHGVDDSSALIYAMDLTPLLINRSLDVKRFALDHIEHFSRNVAGYLDKLLGLQ